MRLRGLALLAGLMLFPAPAVFTMPAAQQEYLGVLQARPLRYRRRQSPRVGTR
jgi:hypothetical protein